VVVRKDVEEQVDVVFRAVDVRGEAGDRVIVID
jgi:hypothetical protein